jgi:hypothetical protein
MAHDKQQSEQLQNRAQQKQLRKFTLQMFIDYEMWKNNLRIMLIRNIYGIKFYLDAIFKVL